MMHSWKHHDAMRTTVNLREDLLRRAKRAAADRASTLSAVVEMALREFLARLEKAPTIAPVDLPRSRHKGGVQSGVDLDDTAALLDRLEDRR